jgi:hypothetical protein
LFLFSQIERKRAIASSDRWSGFGFGDAKLSFGKDSLRLGACVTIPNIRYFDPLRLAADGQHVAHAAFVHAHPEALEALVDVSYLLARGWAQGTQGDLGESE